jgi:ubiquinone/menaquinone biosynthesis C-methylase UbiE
MARNVADARFWDRTARRYAADPIEDQDGYVPTVDRTRHYLLGTDTVLELGCGTGTTALQLAAHVSRIVATDLSSEMIAIAREKAAVQACGNAEFAVATPERASWPDGSFDAVLAFNLWHLFAVRTSALSHVQRVLKPGGLFVSKTPCLAEMNPLIRLALPMMQLVGKARDRSRRLCNHRAGQTWLQTQGCPHLHRCAKSATLMWLCLSGSR